MELSIITVIRDQFRMLLFLPVKPRLELRWWYLGWGLFTAWVAGVGRYWDRPSVEWYDGLGLVSVVYCFVLAIFLYLVILPLRPKNWSYVNVLIFVSMTAMPGWLYAIPVEKFLAVETAYTVNFGLLGVVSAWRVGLLLAFLVRAARLSPVAAVMGAFFPLGAIVAILVVTDVAPWIMAGMAGTHEPRPVNPDDGGNALILIIAMLLAYGLPVFALGYVVCAVMAFQQRKREPNAASPGL